MARISQLLIINVLLVFCSCKEKSQQVNKQYPEPSELSGDALAIQHCSSCHAFVPPGMLTKQIWEEDVLPSMGHRLGIYQGSRQPDSLFDPGIGGSFIRKANIYPEQPLIAREDWQKIRDYFLKNAPEEISVPVREEKISIGLRHFNTRVGAFAHRPPLTIMIKLLAGGDVVIGDGKRGFSNLTFLDQQLNQDYNTKLKTTPIHYYEQADTLYLTTVGKSVYPHDTPDGNILKLFKKEGTDQYRNAKVMLKGLQRPVHVSYGDLNEDELEDLVVCEYGNHTGKLSWFKNLGNSAFEKFILKAKPGAIKTELTDFDGDGKVDILALMAQGDEGLFLFKNQGGGSFEEIRLLSFLPLYGSQYFELHDFDGDGDLDILYVCGDNADQTPILKDYHGIYIFLNQGNNQFKEAYFYQLNGAYNAMARDYDLDGDLDIAAISFFPDYVNYPEESFVYLENVGEWEYKAFSFENASMGRWIVMDAEDMDADGDIDLALGSYVAFIADGDTTGLGERWIKTGPSVVVLENTVR